MKIHPSLTAALSLAGFSFSAGFQPLQTVDRATRTSLKAHKKEWLAPAVTAAVGWTLAAQMAVAGPVFDASQAPIQESSSLYLADNMSLDFSMPSYNPGSTASGFGEGVEAYLQEGGGNGEKEKQMEAMRKAEEARKERLAKQKELAKQRAADDKARALAKKAENERRLKNIWD